MNSLFVSFSFFLDRMLCILQDFLNNVKNPMQNSPTLID